MVVKQPKFTRVGEPTLICNHQMKHLGFLILLLEAFEFCRTTTGRVAKLAHWVYRMLRYGMKYVDRGAAFYETEHQRFQIKHLKWTAAKLGYKVTLLPAA